jgi:uncharacterized membrane protein YhaH (DUF805 family)
MGTLLFLSLLALLYYLRAHDRWWLGFAALLTIFLKMGHNISIFSLGLYIVIAKVLKEAFHTKE